MTMTSCELIQCKDEQCKVANESEEEYPLKSDQTPKRERVVCNVNHNNKKSK